MDHLPELIPINEIKIRLEAIFPDGTQNRMYFVREMAAKTVFVMLYIGAVARLSRWLGPKHVYAMTDAQAKLQSDDARMMYGNNAWKAGYKPRGKSWYADTTREPIRDETLRNGFVSVGAAIENNSVVTTSSQPRYALEDEFAMLFDPLLRGETLAKAIEAWQEQHLNTLALARIKLIKKGAGAKPGQVEVMLPNGSIRYLAQGPSSIISKAVIEEFSRRFLRQPAVVLLSESGNKIAAQEDELIAGIGLKIEASRLLPDIILFDLAPQQELLVFVEVVATDGPVTEKRREALLKITSGGHIPPKKIAFVTAYEDRGATAFKKTFGSAAWDSLIWFMSEPDHVVLLRSQPILEKRRVFELLDDEI